MPTPNIYIYTYICVCNEGVSHSEPLYTEQNYKSNTLVFAPIFHEMNSKDLRLFICIQKAYFSQILFTNLSKSVLVSTYPLPR